MSHGKNILLPSQKNQIRFNRVKGSSKANPNTFEYSEFNSQSLEKTNSNNNLYEGAEGDSMEKQLQDYGPLMAEGDNHSAKKKEIGSNKKQIASQRTASQQDSKKVLMEYYRKSYLPFLLKVEIAYKSILLLHKDFFFRNFIQLYLANIQGRYNQELRRSEQDQLNELMENLNNFAEILQHEAQKYFLNIINDILLQKRIYLGHMFFRQFMLFEKLVTIKKKKAFVYFHKLLVFRNVLLDYTHFYKNITLIKCIFFYRWKRLKYRKKLEMKSKLMKLFIYKKPIEKPTLSKFVISFLSNFGLAKIKRELFSENDTEIIFFLFDSLIKNNLIIKSKADFLRKLKLIQPSSSSEKKVIQKISNMLPSNSNSQTFRYLFIEKLDLFNPQLGSILKRIRSQSPLIPPKTIYQMLSCLSIILKNLKKSFSNSRLVENFLFWKKNNIESEFVMKVNKNNTHVMVMGNSLSKLIIWFNVAKFHLNQLYHVFFQRLKKTDPKLSEQQMVQRSLYFLETNYNHQLVKITRGYFLLFHCNSRKKLFKLNISPEKKSMSALFAKVFAIWKYKCIRIWKERKVRYPIYMGLNLFENLMISSRATRQRKFLILQSLEHSSKILAHKKLPQIIHIAKYLIFSILLPRKRKLLRLLKLTKDVKQCIKQKHMERKENVFCKIISNFNKSKFLRRWFQYMKYLIHAYIPRLIKMKNKLIDFINLLNYLIVKKQCELFFSLYRKKLRFCKGYLPQAKNKIDNQVIKNISKVTLYLHQIVLKKTLLCKSTKLLQSCYQFYQRKTSPEIFNANPLGRAFSSWRRFVFEGKGILLEQIKSDLELEEELKLKIIEYSEANEVLEKKLQDITERGGQCAQCNLLVNESMNDYFTNTITSIRDEDIQHINSIPALAIKPMLHNDAEVAKTVINKEKNGNNINNQNNLSKRQSKLGDSNIDSNAIALPQVINIPDNDNEDLLILDENMGGLEYYSYLKKMGEDLQNKIKGVDQEYTPKCDKLIEEINELYKEVEQLASTSLSK